MATPRNNTSIQDTFIKFLVPMSAALAVTIVVGLFTTYQEVQANTDFRNKGERFTLTDGKELTNKVEINARHVAKMDGKMDLLLEGIKTNNDNIKELNKLNIEILNRLSKAD